MDKKRTVCYCGDIDCVVSEKIKKKIAREVEEMREIGEDEVEDEDLKAYKRFGVG